MNKFDKNIWFRIFLKLEPPDTKPLRYVCKKFHTILNDRWFLQLQMQKIFPKLSKKSAKVLEEEEYLNFLQKREIDSQDLWMNQTKPTFPIHDNHDNHLNGVPIRIGNPDDHRLIAITDPGIFQYNK